jgi:pimeloyl-ACP methyl ester carboxylesterase
MTSGPIRRYGPSIAAIAKRGVRRGEPWKQAALIEHFALAPAWVIGNSFGASITLRLAGARSRT